MTLALAGVDTLPPEPLRQRALSQWYTPAWLAEEIVKWSHAVPADLVLEPSCGRGALLKPMQARGLRAVAMDIDPRNAEACMGLAHNVECADYLSTRASADIAIMNPPFEGGLAEDFVMKAALECRDVVALLPAAIFYGKGRGGDFWPRLRLLRVAFLSERPNFGGKHGAKTDFVVVHVQKRERATDMQRPSVEWWSR